MRWYRKATNNEHKVSLTDQERAIFDLLLEVQRSRGLPGQIRVAGGWVRDKLLGRQSDDIDVVLEGMTGEFFARQMSDYAQEYQKSTGHPHPAGDMQSYTAANALRTSGVKVYGQGIDLVNLRSEAYDESSRTPQIAMGTPRQDAERRDLTINALFYNLNTGEVEDFTGHGMDDLGTMTLRTPLDPKETFEDDPLRTLRVLRFYTRFPNSRIDPRTIRAMGDPDVQDAYRRKVSPERAAKELFGRKEGDEYVTEGVFGGNRPADALRLLLETGLYRAVMDVPEMNKVGELKMDQRNPHHAHDLMDHTLETVRNMDHLSRENGLTRTERILMNVAALFHDFGKAYEGIAIPKEGAPGQMTYHGHEEKSVEVSNDVLKRAGMGAKERDMVTSVIGAHMEPHSSGWNPRKFLRRNPETWRLVMLHSMADAMASGVDEGMAEEMALKRSRLADLEKRATEAPPVQMSKTLLDGHELMRMFPGISPSKMAGDPPIGFITLLKAKLLEAQDAGMTSQDDAIALVESLRPMINGLYVHEDEMDEQDKPDQGKNE